MRDTIYIRFTSDDTDSVSWHIANNNGAGRTTTEYGTLEQAAESAAGKDIIILIPTSDILLTKVSMPTSKRQRIRKALPYALEDQLLTDVEYLHFAMGDRKADATIPVAVIIKQILHGRLQTLDQAGLSVKDITPDVFGLPIHNGEWTILLEDNICTVRTGQQSGFTVEPENLITILTMMLSRTSEDAPSLLRFYDCCKQVEKNTHDLNELSESLNLECIQEACEPDALLLFAKNFIKSHAINLLQDEFSVTEIPSASRRAWYIAATLFGVWLLGQIGMGVYQNHSLTKENDTLKTDIEQLFRQTFPQVKRLVNPRVQIQQQIAASLQGKQQTDKPVFLHLLSHTGGILHSYSNIELSGLNYRDGHLDLQVRLTDLQKLDELKQKINETGLKVELRSANAGKDYVLGTLRISRGTL